MVNPMDVHMHHRAEEALHRNRQMSFFRRLLGHTWMILRHKYWVFHFACIAGIPWQGIMHDWSKFSRMEFWESVHWYNGIGSPIWLCKMYNHGLSYAWIHHHGRNLHHYEAWQDDFDHGAHPVDMPYPYAVEMLCDFLAAGKAYGRDQFTFQSEYEWWQHKKARGVAMTDHMKAFVEAALSTLARTEDVGLLKPASTKRLYEKYVENAGTSYMSAPFPEGGGPEGQGDK